MRSRLPLFLILVTGLFWLLSDAADVRAAVGDGLILCAQSVIPSLFPFLVVSTLLISLGFGEALARPLGGMFRALYGIGGEGASALVLGLAGDYPVGARTAAELYRSGRLSRQESERLLAFCSNANPAFLINVLGRGVFNSGRAGVYLWVIHVLSALLTGLVLCRGRDASPSCPPPSRTPLRTVRLADALVDAVRTGLNAVLGICAFVTFFRVLTLPLRGLNGAAGAAVCGATELFSAVPILPAGRGGFILAAALAGWGGLCVHCQTMAAVADSRLSLRRYLPGKALQGVLSALLAAALAGRALR